MDGRNVYKRYQENVKKMKNNLDTRREYWGRVHDMVDAYNEKHGTDVRSWECVRYRGTKFGFQCHPSDMVLSGHVEFAVAIVEGSPVFVGDTVYDKLLSYPLTVENGDSLIYGTCLRFNELDWDKISWNPPKKPRTFTLNGVELPCPINPKAGGDMEFCDHLILDRRFFFKNEEELERCLEAFCCLLEEARDKE